MKGETFAGINVNADNKKITSNSKTALLNGNFLLSHSFIGVLIWWFLSILVLDHHGIHDCKRKGIIHLDFMIISLRKSLIIIIWPNFSITFLLPVEVNCKWVNSKFFKLYRTDNSHHNFTMYDLVKLVCTWHWALGYCTCSDRIPNCIQKRIKN